MKLKDLGITEEQATYEIVVMREFDKEVRKIVGDDIYGDITAKVCRNVAESIFEKHGIEAEEIFNRVDMEMFGKKGEDNYV